MNINDIPGGIPASRKKQALLNEKGIENIYLGQGLMFVPPVEAERDYNKYLVGQGLNKNDYPLDVIRKKGKAGDVYNSPTLDKVWKKIHDDQYDDDGYRESEAFGQFIRQQSCEIFAKLYELDSNIVATTQVDNLMRALSSVQKAVPELMNGRFIDSIILPKQYKYSGHTDFLASNKKIGLNLDLIEIPEIQIDGTQDLDVIRQKFEKVRDKGGLALMIDQEHNNNASGFDRDSSYNDALSKILKEFQGSVIYFGDNAYKGLKEDIVEGYDFMKQLINDGVMAFHYTSFSKIGNYRGTPGYQNILAATPGERSNTGELRTILADIQKTDTKELLAGLTSIQRADGIGATADGAILMRKLIDNKDFQQEVRVLNQYLKYTRDTLKKELEGTQLEPYFSEKTNGIFRCVPSEVTKILNSGKKQAITVGDRINIWPLGDPKNREFFLEALK